MRTEPTFTWIEPPIGPQPLPAWAKGVEIEWMGHFCNPPHLKVKTVGSPMPEGVLWHKDGARYWRRSPEGFHEENSHAGSLTWSQVDEAWLTSRDDGYGGRCWRIRMAPEGQFEPPFDVVLLRGPWNGDYPADCDAVAYFDMRKRYGRADSRPRPWHKETFTGGVYMTHDLIVRLLARFQPHLRIARVEHHGRVRIEPVKPEWDAPKFVIIERERQEYLAKRQAAE
jgi:hypothetical protein